MESTSEQISLSEALSEARISELPKPIKNNNMIWIKAIVKVTKCTGTSNYAIGVNNGNGKPSIINDFGKTAKIVRIDGIYPYMYMDSKGIPDLRNKQEIIDYLAENGFTAKDTESLLSTKNELGENKTPEQIKSDREKIKFQVYYSAVQVELKKINDRNRAQHLNDKYEKRRTKERNEECY